MSFITVQGILYDEKSSFMRGAADAPPYIRRVLNNGAANFSTELGVDLRNLPMDDKGDFTPKDYFGIKKITLDNLEVNKPLLTLGGDHSITYPVLLALAERYSAIDILHIDAHADLYDEYEGDKYSHACPFARIMEENLAKKLIQVGIRTLTTHQRAQVARFNVDCRELKDYTLNNLSHFENPLYISLDMDGIDPAFAPGVAHHEPGGLTSRQVFDLIQQIDSPIIGADIVEYNPKRDVSDITGALAAKLMREIWGKMVMNSK